MKYELVNQIDPNSEAWRKIQARARKEHKHVIGLAAAQNFGQVMQAAKLQGETVVDFVCRRRFDPKGYRFFNDVPVPTGDKVQMYGNGSVFIEHGADPIAREFLFPNTRRAVQDIRYTNPDGTLDYIQEFAADGALYSNVFYYHDDLQEIDFYNMDEQVVLRYFFYEGNMNLITIEDPITHTVTERFNNMADFLIAQVAKMVKAGDVVTISYMGIEMEALSQTTSHNILQPVESPFDDQGNVRGNLRGILGNEIPYIHEVRVPIHEYQELGKTDLPLIKVKLGN